MARNATRVKIGRSYGSGRSETGRKRRFVLALGALLILAQFLQLERTNPPIESDVPTTAAVKTILRRACYDCHSHETAWPWYSRVAPISWYVVWDVNRGREEVDFSSWNAYDDKRRQKILKDTVDEVNEREMPPWSYTLLHPHAELTDSDRAVLAEWARAQQQK